MHKERGEGFKETDSGVYSKGPNCISSECMISPFLIKKFKKIRVCLVTIFPLYFLFPKTISIFETKNFVATQNR